MHLHVSVRKLKEEAATEPGKAREVAERLLRAQHMVELRREALRIFAKEHRARLERAQLQLDGAVSERKRYDEQIEKTLRDLTELRKLEREMAAYVAERAQKLDRECAIIRKGFPIAPTEEELAVLEARNEELKEAIRAKIEAFQSGEQNREAQSNELEQAIAGLRLSTLSKYEEVQKRLTEKQTQQIEAEIEKNRVRELRDTVARMSFQAEGYEAFIAEKHRQYNEYVKNVYLLLDKIRMENERKQALEDRCVTVNKIYLGLFQENSELEVKVKAEQEKTETLKKKCKDLQETRK